MTRALTFAEINEKKTTVNKNENENENERKNNEMIKWEIHWSWKEAEGTMKKKQGIKRNFFIRICVEEFYIYAENDDCTFGFICQWIYTYSFPQFFDDIILSLMMWNGEIKMRKKTWILLFT